MKEEKEKFSFRGCLEFCGLNAEGKIHLVIDVRPEEAEALVKILKLYVKEISEFVLRKWSEEEKL